MSLVPSERVLRETLTRYLETTGDFADNPELRQLIIDTGVKEARATATSLAKAPVKLDKLRDLINTVVICDLMSVIGRAQAGELTL